MTLTIESPNFAHLGHIPQVYTCDGADVSVELCWQGVPEDAKSLALIVDDPDAPDPKTPQVTWVHWLLYNLGPDSTGLPPAVTAKQLPPGTQEGLNDWNRTGYNGPCPPTGQHRYFFKLYALDTQLPDLHEPTKAKLEQAMYGHIIAQAEVVGVYQRG